MTTSFHNRIHNRRGVSIFYALILLTTLFGLASLAVDWGRVQMAKTQLRAGADAASRHAAMLLPNGASTAIAGAQSAARENVVDNTRLALDPAQDIEIGYWDVSARRFTRLTGSARANANAARVIARRVASRGTAIPTIFAEFFHHESSDIMVESISMLKPPRVIDTDVPATVNPFLAGMPNGTYASLNNPHNNPDRAPAQSPILVQNMNLKPGEVLTFDNINGGANNDYHWDAHFMPDGNLDWIVNNYNGPEHGKSDLTAPINALVGVFLTDNADANLSPPPTLNFTSAASRDFSELRPQVRQIFFIGDGKRSDGTAQRFVVPPGATRFYVANWDGYEWNNNVGLRTTRITRLGSVVTVK